MHHHPKSVAVAQSGTWPPGSGRRPRRTATCDRHISGPSDDDLCGPSGPRNLTGSARKPGGWAWRFRVRGSLAGTGDPLTGPGSGLPLLDLEHRHVAVVGELHEVEPLPQLVERGQVAVSRREVEPDQAVIVVGQVAFEPVEVVDGIG